MKIIFTAASTNHNEIPKGFDYGDLADAARLTFCELFAKITRETPCF